MHELLFEALLKSISDENRSKTLCDTMPDRCNEISKFRNPQRNQNTYEATRFMLKFCLFCTSALFLTKKSIDNFLRKKNSVVQLGCSSKRFYSKYQFVHSKTKTSI